VLSKERGDRGEPPIAALHVRVLPHTAGKARLVLIAQENATKTRTNAGIQSMVAFTIKCFHDKEGNIRRSDRKTWRDDGASLRAAVAGPGNRLQGL
jgi:hypothetical protein